MIKKLEKLKDSFIRWSNEKSVKNVDELLFDIFNLMDDMDEIKKEIRDVIFQYGETDHFFVGKPYKIKKLCTSKVYEVLKQNNLLTDDLFYETEARTIRRKKKRP